MRRSQIYGKNSASSAPFYPLVWNQHVRNCYKQLQKDWDTRCFSGQFGHCYSQYTFTPLPLFNVVMDLVMIFKVTSNNIERGRGIQKCIKVFHLFSRVCFQLVIQFLRRINVSTILQLLVALLAPIARYTVQLHFGSKNTSIFFPKETEVNNRLSRSSHGHSC